MTDRAWNICSACAKAKGWEAPTWAVTVTVGTCPYCGEHDQMLTPIVDFRREGKAPVWD